MLSNLTATIIDASTSPGTALRRCLRDSSAKFIPVSEIVVPTDTLLTLLSAKSTRTPS